MKSITFSSIFIILACCLFSQLVFAERIKDLASIAGVRSNQLVGYLNEGGFWRESNQRPGRRPGHRRRCPGCSGD